MESSSEKSEALKSKIVVFIRLLEIEPVEY
jgi:hypothetical protein